MDAAIAKTDRQIQQKVMRELRASGWLRDAEIGVEVDRGVVTLTGTVATMEKKVAAERAAHRAEGVLDVADDIDLKYPGSPARTDAEIAREVRRLLQGIAGVDDREIRTTVSDGCVWLEGTSETLAGKAAAAAAARRLPGVRGLINRLTAAVEKKTIGQKDKEMR